MQEREIKAGNCQSNFVRKEVEREAKRVIRDDLRSHWSKILASKIIFNYHNMGRLIKKQKAPAFDVLGCAMNNRWANESIRDFHS